MILIKNIEPHILPDENICPKNFCFHWLNKDDNYSVGLFNNEAKALKSINCAEISKCGNTLGKCKRLYGEGSDFYEPNEPILKKAGLPDFFFISNPNNYSININKYNDYFFINSTSYIKQGVTGFENNSVLDDKTIKNSLYNICFENNIKILNFDFDLTTKNYYIIEINIENESIFVFINSIYKIILLSSSKSLQDKLFNFNENLIAIFNIDFFVITEDIIKDEINKTIINQLSKTEIEQIKYWKPLKTYEIIFNHWD